MHRLKSWWRRKGSSAEEPQASPSPEWTALESAVLKGNFSEISVCIRAWCMLIERDIDKLLTLAERAEFDTVAVNKLKILFSYFSRNVGAAFSDAQEHMSTYGYDSDLHVLSLACLYQNNQFEGAQAYLRNLNEIQLLGIERADYWQMVSIIRWANNEMEALEQAADRTVTLAPNDPAVLQTALAMYIELGIQEKIDAVRAALEGIPGAVGYAYSLSMLALGEADAGWRQMEARYDIEDVNLHIFNQAMKSYPRWKGEPLSGQRLLLTAEQGLGDTIQMARYVPMLAALGAKEILLETQPETLTLLQYNFPNVPMVERQWAIVPDLKFDRWIGTMSLPYHLKAWGINTPGRAGYLRVPPDNTQYWQRRVAQLSPRKVPKVGLAWSGQPNHRADRRRSVPFELMMAQVRQVDAVFFALQTQVPQIMPPNVMNVTEEMITLADTAALIEQMDIVITVDTSVVHIAGALGKKTWLLLPKRYEWRWGLEGEDNDWYDSVKAIRQTEHAQWLPVLKEVFERRLREQFNL